MEEQRPSTSEQHFQEEYRSGQYPDHPFPDEPYGQEELPSTSEHFQQEYPTGQFPNRPIPDEPDPEQPHPNASAFQQNTSEEKYQRPPSASSPAKEKELKFLSRLLLISMACLCLVGTGAVVTLVLVFTDMFNDDDEPSTSSASKEGGTVAGVNVPPTLSPTRSPTMAETPGVGTQTFAPTQPSLTNPTQPTPSPTSATQATSTATNPTQTAPTTATTTQPASAPTTPAPAPITPSPTKQKLWQRVGGLLVTQSDQEDTKFGFAVALVGSEFLAIGEPALTTTGFGDVTIRDRSNNWAVDDSELSVGTTHQFGFALDAAVVGGMQSILVGATETLQNGVQYGSAHYYQRDDSDNWSPLGNAIRPPLVSAEKEGKFGTAVAMATDIPRIAIGAPDTMVAFGEFSTGRVHTYELSGSLWNPMDSPLDGIGPDRRFGTSVALSKDGSRLLVGSPGHKDGSGAIFCYQWNGTIWESILSLAGEYGEAMGTTVAFISDNADMIAWGGPDFENGQGMISVFLESPPGFWSKINNEDIYGADGDRIGTTLSGAKGRLAFGTENGSFNVYEHNGTSWAQVATGPNLASRVVSISMSDDGNSVAVGLENEKVAVYDFS